MKSLIITDELHLKIKKAVVNGNTYKTIQDLVVSAIENELHELETK